MIIAITGATGFIGRLLVQRHLDQNDEVRVLSRKQRLNDEMLSNTVHYQGGLSEIDLLKRFLDNVDVLYHCAAELLDESTMSETNLQGTKNLIAVAEGNLKHWVQLSSVGVYGPIYSGIVTESRDCEPVSMYERTKLAADKEVIEQLPSLNISYTIIRPSNVIGESMTNRSVYQLISKVEKGQFFFIGKTGASANYVPVENVIEALILGGTHPNARNEIFNISNWNSFEDFIEYIAEALNKRYPRWRLPLGLTKIFAGVLSVIPNNPLTISRINALSSRARYSTEKIERQLSYKPLKTVKESVFEMVTKFKEKTSQGKA